MPVRTTENIFTMKDQDKTQSPQTTGEVRPDEQDESIDAVPLYQRMRIVIPVFAVIVLAAAGWWYWYVNYREFNSTDDAYIDANRVSISSKMLGRIIFLAADEGDTVKKGEVIVRLDDSDLRAQEEQAKAALVSAEQNVVLAKVSLEKAVDDLHRAETQFKQNVIPQEQFDHATKAQQMAQAQYTIAVAQVGTTRAQLSVVQTNLQNMTITAPMDGTISKRWVLVGDVIQPAQPVYTIYDMKNIWVTANFEETKLASIHLNDKVTISVDTYPDLDFSGTVFQLGSNTASEFSLIPPNNASGNFTKITQRVPVKISIQNPNPARIAFLPGMSVEVKVKVR